MHWEIFEWKDSNSKSDNKINNLWTLLPFCNFTGSFTEIYFIFYFLQNWWYKEIVSALLQKWISHKMLQNCIISIINFLLYLRDHSIIMLSLNWDFDIIDCWSDYLLLDFFWWSSQDVIYGWSLLRLLIFW